MYQYELKNEKLSIDINILIKIFILMLKSYKQNLTY